MAPGDGEHIKGRHLLPAIFSSTEWKVLAAHLALSRRQADVARLICRGLRKSEIAEELGVTEYTVRMHANALYRRLKVHDRVGVVVRLVLTGRSLARRRGKDSAS